LVFNLINDRWIPARCSDGAVETIAPWEITDRIDDDAFVGFAWPRADFDGAAHEFLIGLLATAAAPADDEEWLAWWEAPPAPELLRKRFAEFADAFALDGDGARFMQDMDLLDGAVEVDVGALLIDAPGENTLRKNADLFVKRGTVSVLSRAAAAMALFTLQAYAPSGGQGHRTSLRGGGPLTTLALAQRIGQPPNLWGRLWPNVETRAAIESRGVPGRNPVASGSSRGWHRPALQTKKRTGGQPVRATPTRYRSIGGCRAESACCSSRPMGGFAI
jgi:CRISPR system Cascade subunit CasA